MKRLIRQSNARIVKADNDAELFIQECEKSGKFDNGQMKEIKFGLSDDNYFKLTVEQVKVYADPKFNATQMAQLRYALEQGVPVEQVKLFAKPEISGNKMCALVLELTMMGVPFEQLKERYNLASKNNKHNRVAKSIKADNDIDIAKFTNDFDDIYNNIYNNDPPINDIVEYGDNLLSSPNAEVSQILKAFNKYREDFISSDREVASFVLALQKNRIINTNFEY